MPNRIQRQSMVDLLTRVPVNRGSLLKSIENLLKTIETSENAVMIPTLLKDKVRVDAWELLFVAKILKASILGHGDLVEFYMNHIHQNAAAQQLVEQPPSPSQLARQQSSPAMSSPLLTSHSNPAAAAKTLEQAHSNLSNGSSNTNGNTDAQKSSHVSWIAASQQQPAGASLSSGSLSSAGSSSLGSTSSSSCCSSSSSSASSFSANETTPQQPTMDIIPEDGLIASAPVQPAPTNSQTQTQALAPLKVADDEQQPQPQPHQEALLTTASRPPTLGRQAQPPSLLQLTTTNNHINSVSELLNYNSPLSPSLDQLTQHLISLQIQQASAIAATPSFELPANPSALSIATGNQPATNGHSGAQADSQHLPAGANNVASSAQTTPVVERRHEPLKSSRSAGCLFRANSGASSPRTPSTSYPQAETLAGTAGANGIVGDPTSLVKLLLQVEQLKTSIVNVNALLDSVVDLYKKSIDNIAQ